MTATRAQVRLAETMFFMVNGCSKNTAGTWLDVGECVHEAVGLTLVHTWRPCAIWRTKKASVMLAFSVRSKF